jgi:hypothetical protein
LIGGPEAARRDFSYHDQLADHYPYNPTTGTGARKLSDYHLPLQPGGFVSIELYPLAFFSTGVAANLGLTFDFHKGLTTTSSYVRDEEKNEFENLAQRWDAGVRIRSLMGPVEAGVSAGYGQQKFFLKGDETAPIVPDVKYEYVRFGVDTSLALGRFTLGARLGVRALGALGEVETLWFRGATGTGFAGGLFAWYALSQKFGIALGGDYVRYALDFSAIPLSSRVAAGGAIDQYLSGWLGVRFQLTG